MIPVEARSCLPGTSRMVRPRLRSVLAGLGFLLLLAVSPPGAHGGPSVLGGEVTPLARSPVHTGPPMPAVPTPSAGGERELAAARASLERDQGPSPALGPRGSWASSDGWREVTNESWPMPLEQASMVYDASDGYVLLYSGVERNALFVTGAVYSFHGGVWTLVDRPPSDPTPGLRYGSSMVYDAADGYVVMFGGEGPSGNALADTWTFHGGIWTPIFPSTSPPARWSAGMAYDAADGYAVLFSGRNSPFGAPLTDTWEFKAGQWTQDTSSASSPPGLVSPAMADDAADGYAVLFGGTGGISLYSIYGETWEFKAGQWTLLETRVTGPNHPTATCYLWAGGVNTTSTGPCPWPRTEASLTDDSTGGRLVLFGGLTYGSLPSDASTWAFSGGVWANSTGSLQVPPARALGVSCDDPAVGGLVLFGGRGNASSMPDLNDVWTFHAGQWAPVGPSVTAPPPLDSAQMTYDAADGYVLLLGGEDGQVLNLTWTFRGGTWSPLTIPGRAPSPRILGAMVDDPTDGFVLLFGGMVAGGPGVGNFPAGDTWAYRGGVWTQLEASAYGPFGQGALCYAYASGLNTSTTVTCPPSMFTPTMSYDSADGYVVLFGGCEAVLCPAGDTWTFHGGLWTQQMAPANGPNDRSELCYRYSGGTNTSTTTLCPKELTPAWMADDAPDGEAILCGGLDVLGQTNNDTWAFAGGIWTNITAGGPAPPIESMAANIADASRDGPVALETYLGTGQPVTWEFHAGRWHNATLPGPFPQVSAYSSFAYDAADGVDLLFGGFQLLGGSVYSGETWSLSFPLSATVPSATPADLDVGQTSGLSVSVAGGARPYSYAWNGLPPACSSVDRPALNCTPTSSAGSPFSVTVVATDANGNTLTSTPLVLTVNPAPAVQSFAVSPAWVDVGGLTTFSAVTAGGSSPLTLTYGDLPPGCTTTNVSALSCRPSGAGTFHVVLWANDTIGGSASAATTLAVGTALGITSFTASPPNITVGRTLALSVVAAGGLAPFTYVYMALPPGCASSNVSNLDCVPTSPGSYTVAANVTDRTGRSAQATASLVVTLPSAPKITSFTASPGTISVGGTTALLAVVSGSGSWLEYSYSGLPPGCSSVNATGFSCTPTVTGDYIVALTVMDPWGQLASASTTLTVAPTLPGPAIADFSVSPVSVSVGQQVTFNATIAGGIAPFTWSYSGLPQGCSSLNSSSFSCTPAEAGSFVVHLSISDHDARTAQANVSLTVTVGKSSGSAGGLAFVEGLGAGALVTALILGAVLRLVLRRKPVPPKTMGEEPDSSSSSSSDGVAAPPSAPKGSTSPSSTTDAPLGRDE